MNSNKCKILLIIIIIIKSILSLTKNQINISVTPQNTNNIYDIEIWARQLNLQQCAIVEIGEEYCALFLEVIDNNKFDEYFLGICECKIMRNWQLCSPILTKQRYEDCIFKEATEFSNIYSRVHRRLCDITAIAEWAMPCNCTNRFADKQLTEVTGFPTCLLSPLPESICYSNVCGTYKCITETVAGGVHKVHCHKKCHGKQPFCEEIGPSTTKLRHINSTWSNWSYPKCNGSCGAGVLISTAKCIHKDTKKESLDCLGPGTMCCQPEMGDCTCTVSHRDGYLQVSRTTNKCVDKKGCN